MGSNTLGSPIFCDIERSEDDTNDLNVHLVDALGIDANVVAWVAQLSIGSDNNTALVPAQLYNGVGTAGGLIPIDMNAFNLTVGSYRYDIRITDTVTSDSPVRVYFKGSFKVTPRVN
jgi:hypothetical protein